MSALTSLLVRDRVVSVSKIEEALQHQVLSGGDIETILLEMNFVQEDVLAAYRAALYGLLPATREEVMRASREALRQMPRDMARGFGILPILFEGRALVAAACDPPGEETAREIRNQLGCELTVRIVTQLRLSAGLAHHYGFELEPRLRRLADVLRKREPGIIPYVRPPSPSLKPSFRPAAPGFKQFGTAAGSDVFDEPALAAEFPLVVHESEPVPDFETAGGMISSAAVFIPAPSSPGGPIPAGSLAGFQVERATTMPPSTVSPQVARSVRGPISTERASELLLEASQRDDVLFVLLRYAQQFFDFVGIFSLGKDGARGRMAHGAGLSQELMEQVVIPLSGGGLIARCARDKRPLVGDLSAVDEERAALVLLGRPSGRPGLAVPIVIGARAAMVLYADRNGEGVSASDAEPIALVVAGVSTALRRIILEQKTLRQVASVPPPPPRPASEPPAAVSADAADETAVEQSSSDADTALEGAEAARESEPAGEPAFVSGHEPGPADSATPEPVDAPQPAAVTAEPQAAEPLFASETASGLTAVDLESVSRPAYNERRRSMSGPQAAVLVKALAPELREAARGRVPGVPRSAPPPPLRESVPPPAPPAVTPSSKGAYSFVAPPGSVVEEIVRPSRGAPRNVSAQRDAHETAAATPATNQALKVPEPEEVPQPEPEKPSIPAPLAGNSARSATRLALVAPNAAVPSVIIDMGDQVDTLVESLMSASPSDALGQIAELLSLGEGVLPVLLQHFPGPLWFDPKQLPRRSPRGRDVSALARAIVAFGPRAAPYLASKLATSDAEVCRYALMVAGEIVHADLLDSVARRAFDANDGLRAAALDVLRTYASVPQFESVLRAISELSERPGKDPRRQRLALAALGELRDQRSLKALLPRLSDPNEGIAQAAHKALVTLTAHDFGTSQRKWETWAEQWATAHRAEWLIDALLHSDETVRGLAGEELKQLTQQYFGYHPALPKRDREVAQRKYREWWEHEGRRQFAR